MNTHFESLESERLAPNSPEDVLPQGDDADQLQAEFGQSQGISGSPTTKSGPVQFRMSTLLIATFVLSLLTLYCTKRYQAKAELNRISDRINTFFVDETKPYIESLRSLPSDNTIEEGRSNRRSSFNGLPFQYSVATQRVSHVFRENGVRDEHVFFVAQVRLAGLAFEPVVNIMAPVRESHSQNGPSPEFNEPLIKKLRDVLETEFEVEVNVIPARPPNMNEGIELSFEEATNDLYRPSRN